MLRGVVVGFRRFSGKSKDGRPFGGYEMAIRRNMDEQPDGYVGECFDTFSVFDGNSGKFIPALDCHVRYILQFSNGNKRCLYLEEDT